MKKWWNAREETERSWLVSADSILSNGCNLDIKNPHVAEEEKTHSTAELLGLLGESFEKSEKLLQELKMEIK